ncbi:hypothetical protein BSKO_10706 [Bryopsis sp. KO-2023]|nr:hypothetical protein BSKO_10706 [Bryopsis sp. KO-2023]
MGTSINFTPLCGVRGNGPLCYFLEFGGCRCLLDCGWSEPFDVSELEPLKRIASTIDVVLLSHPDPQHLGGIPYAMNKFGMKAKIFATLPVVKMGQMFLYDHCLSRKGHSEFDAFTLDEIDTAFSKINALKYNEEHFVSDFGVTLTAHSAGHLVGGTVWQINKSEQDIVYAVDYNHRKERHLGAVKLHSSLSRPAVLITHCSDFDNPLCDFNKRDRTFLKSIMSTLRDGGNVLIPTDTAGRVLELIILLEEYWSKHRIAYPLALLSTVAYSTMEFAKSQLEWMNDAVTEAFERDRDNPFQCRYLQVCHSCEEVANLPSQPKVVLASMNSMECGMSSELLVQWAGDAKNLIILMDHVQEGTLAHEIEQHRKRKTSDDGLQLRIKLARRVDLEGEELEEFEKKHNRKCRRVDDPEKTNRDAVEGEATREEVYGEEIELDTSPSFDQPLRTSCSSISRLVRQRSGAVVQMLGKEVAQPGNWARADVLIDGFDVPEGVVAPMFPSEDDYVEWDDYGEFFDPKDFFVTEAEDEESELIPVAPEVHEEEMPTKTVMVDMSVMLKAQVRKFDFSGRTNGRFMKHMISEMAPRHLIILHGSAETTQAFKKMAERELGGMQKRVYCPEIGETVDVSSGTNSFRLGLGDDIMQRITLRDVKGYQLAWVEGRVGEIQEGEPPQLLAVHGDSPNTPATETLGGVFIGDVRLSGVKTALEEAGIVAQFHGRSLVCNEDVQIRVQSAGHIVMEGPVSEEYYRIRAVLYGQYHIC